MPNQSHDLESVNWSTESASDSSRDFESIDWSIDAPVDSPDKGVNDTIAQWFTTKHAKELLDKSSGLPPERILSPLPYEDYIPYEHRIDDTTKTIRIGDCQLIIPPDFIAIKEIKNTEQIVSLRQESSMKDQHGYSRKEVTITAFFSGRDQINGYEVPSPFDRPYYVDGLRPLLAQFKCTPFLPVENYFLNAINDIWNLALQSINVTTVEGFPNVLQATIIAHEFNAMPYLETPNYTLGDSIDWDLFRFQYQQLMNESLDLASLNGRKLFKASEGGDLDESFKISLLDLSLLTGEEMNEEIENIDGLFQEVLSNRGAEAQNFVVSEMNFGISNMLSFLQLSAHESPTMQYLGGSDTVINFSIETTDENAVASFRELTQQSKKLVLQSRQSEGIGVIKVENDILRILGTQYLMINNCVIATVPDFPGKFNIYLECLGYDMRTRSREDINGIRPFEANQKGTKDDAISRNPKGLKNKIIQEAMAERRINEMELYPDLFLPYYKEVDYALVKIREFRSKHNLSAHPFSEKYPRKQPLHKIKGVHLTEGFVDPDFYVMYPFDYSSMADLDLLPLTKPRPDAVDITVEYEVEGAGLTGGGANTDVNIKPPPVSVEGFGYENLSKRRQLFLAYLFSEVGQGYVFSAVGQTLTDSLITSFKRSFVEKNKGIDKWKGYRVYDCSGFVMWGLQQVGHDFQGRRPTAALFSTPMYSTAISKSELLPGDLVSTATHIAVYIGDGRVVESASVSKGVVYGVLGNRFTRFSRFKGIDDALPVSKTTAGAVRSQVADTGSATISYGASHGNAKLGSFNDPQRDRWDALIILYAKKYDLNPNYMKALMQQESGMNPNAINSLPAVGLMQLTKPVFQEFGIAFDVDKAKDPEFNIDLGFRYAKKCLELLDNNYEYMVQGYNMGPYGFKSYLRGERSLPKETQKHIEKIRTYYAQLIRNGGTGVATIKDVASSMEKLLVSKKHGSRQEEFAGPLGEPLYGVSPVNDLLDVADNGKDFLRVAVFGDHSIIKGAGEKVYEVSSLLAATAALIAQDNGAAEAFITRLPENVEWRAELIKTIESKNGDAILKVLRQLINDTTHVDIGNIVAEATAFAAKRKNEINAEIVNLEKAIGDVKSYKARTKNFVDKENKDIISRMTVDMVHYSARRTLLRAYPTYAFLIVDESSDWMDGRKLWNNYYNYKSVVSINIHDEKAQPVKTAVLTVTNTNQKLEKTPKEEYIKKGIEDDKEYNPIVRWVFKHTGIFIGGLKVTQQAVDEKNKLVKSMKLEAGARIHIRMGYGSSANMLPVVFNGTVTEMSVGNIITMIAQSDGMELINNVVTTKKDETNKLSLLQREGSDIMASLLTDKQNIFANTINSDWGERNKYGIEHFGSGCVQNTNLIEEAGAPNSTQQKEYDICKNIYMARYDQRLYCGDESLLNFDGEGNINMFLFNKTPWDIMQMTAQYMPEFVCQPMYHQFDTRMFYGLPTWNAKYRYDYDEQSDTIYEYAKSFAQFHMVDSISDIIDNKVVCTDKKLYTNVIAMYTEAGEFLSTPVLYADKNIEWSKQKTKVIDTTILQDYVGPDKVYGLLFGMRQGKENAIRVGIANLLDSFEQMYADEIITIGKPSLKAGDYIMIQDLYAEMSGLATVRSVTHSFSMETGLTTSITPGLITYSKTKDAGTANIVGGLTSMGLSAASLLLGRWTVIIAGKKIAQIVGAAKAARQAKLILDVYNAIKTTEIVTNSSALITKWASALMASGAETKTGAAAIKLGSAIKNSKTAQLLLATNLPAVVLYVAVTILINAMLEALIDFFSYNNCIGIRPLTHKNKYFVTRVKGQKKLIDGANNGTTEDYTSVENEDFISYTEVYGAVDSSPTGEGGGFSEGDSSGGGGIGGGGAF